MNKQANTKTPILEVISNRWSPRAFADKKIDEESLLKLFEAARWAASSMNEQPWRFFVAQKGEEAYDTLFKGLNQWNQKWAFTAPVLLVSIAKKQFDKNGKPNKHALHDLGLAMGNLSAQATELGLSLHQMGGIEPEYLYEALGIDKNLYEVVSMSAIGFQDASRLSELDERYQKAEEAQRERLPLNSLVFTDSFNENPNWI